MDFIDVHNNCSYILETLTKHSSMSIIRDFYVAKYLFNENVSKQKASILLAFCPSVGYSFATYERTRFYS